MVCNGVLPRDPSLYPHGYTHEYFANLEAYCFAFDPGPNCRCVLLPNHRAHTIICYPVTAESMPFSAAGANAWCHSLCSCTDAPERAPPDRVPW